MIDLCSSEDNDSDSEVDVIEEVEDEDDKDVIVLDAHDYVVEPEASDDDDDVEEIGRPSSDDSDDSDSPKTQQDDTEDEETDYEPESEEVVNDQDKFVPRRAPPPKETADVVAAPSGDAPEAEDTIPTPMDTSETEREMETDKADQGNQPMTETAPDTGTPEEKEGMEVVESQAAQDVTEKVTSVTSVTSEEPKEKAAEKSSPQKKSKAKRRKGAAPLYADVGDRATLLRAVNTLTIRQKKSNECIDIENVRASTFRLDDMILF